MWPQQPIKFNDLDKVIRNVEDYSIKMAVKKKQISPMRQQKTRVLFRSEQKHKLVEGNAIHMYAKYHLHPLYSF